MSGSAAEEVETKPGGLTKPPGLYVTKVNGRELSRKCQRSVDIAVVTVLMMQLAIDQVIHVVAVGHCFMTASSSVLVTLADRSGSAGSRIFLRHCNDMFVYVTFMQVMEMAVVQVISVAVVVHRDVTTVGAMLMVMI